MVSERPKEYVFIRCHGGEVAVAVGRRTPAGAAWHRALVVDLWIDPEDARRVGEKAIRAAFLRAAVAERKRTGEGIAPTEGMPVPDEPARPDGSGEGSDGR